MDAQRQQNPSSRSRRWIIALAALNAVVLGYFLAPQTASEQLRRRLEAKLQAHYPHLDVRISAGRITREAIVLEGIELRARWRSSKRPTVPIVKVARLECFADIDLERLIDRGTPLRPRKIVAWDPVADLWQTDEGRWSLELLWPPLAMNGGCPRIEVRGGTLRLHRQPGGQERPLEIDRVNCGIDMIAGIPSMPAVAVPTSSGSVRRAAVIDGVSREIRLELTAASSFIESIKLSGEVRGDRFRFGGWVKGVRTESAMLERLPRKLSEACKPLEGLSVDAELSCQVEGGIHDVPGDYRFAVEALLRDGSYRHPSLPQPLEQIRGQVIARSSGIEIRDATARYGDAQIELTGSTDSWGLAANCQGELRASGLVLDEHLAAKLPGRASALWDELRPSGPIDIDLDWTRQDGKWSSGGEAQLRGVEIRFGRFPYPVSQLNGTITFDPKGASSNGLTGRIGGRTLSIAFRQHSGEGSRFNWLQLAADGPVPIDEPLLTALTTRGQPVSGLERFVRSLNPGGQVQLVAARWDREVNGQPRKSIDLKISGGTLRYHAFPYPLYDVRGQVKVQDDQTRLIGFQASNSDNAKILCEGEYRKVPAGSPETADGLWQVALDFRARELPLDETLRAALHADPRAVWDNLSPTGILETAEVTVRHAANWDRPRVTVAARQTPRPTIDNRTLSIRPTQVPYRIDLIQGAMRFDGNLVHIESLEGRHDATRISADGYCRRGEAGRWRMDLNIHSGSRLHPDAELIGSLPTKIRGGFQRLQLRGPLSARGQVGVWLPDSQNPEPLFDWDMIFQLEGNRIGDVSPVHDLRGEITMRGEQRGDATIADGLVRIDSLHIATQQLTAIEGPYAIRDHRLSLGDAIPQPLDQPAAPTGGERSPELLASARGRPIEGRAYGGTVSLSGDVLLSDGAFDVVMAVSDADLAMILIDLGTRDQTARGKVNGQVRLEGLMGASHLLKGAGSATLSEGKLYQLPLLISVFNMLRIKPSESVAFTDGSARYTIYGDQVTFNELKLWGDLIALDGSGTMNHSREVDLSFNTRVSPYNAWRYVANPLGQNRYTLWTLYVRGPLSEPHIDRRGIEAVGGTLEKLIPSMGPTPPPETATAPPQLRQRLFR
jgi:hypothetical protein